MCKKLNLAFQNFCDKGFRMTNEQVDFDTPFNELAFGRPALVDDQAPKKSKGLYRKLLYTIIVKKHTN
jgi:hypothetical protein